LETDPIESGWLRSYANPGGNITGVFSDFPDFSAKWLELLKEAVPNCAHIVVLWDPATTAVQTKAIPAERPTRFELIVNLQTAKALNLVMPTSILLRADEVIE